MSTWMYYLLSPVLFVGAMVLVFKLLEAIGVTSPLDFELEPREAMIRKRINQQQ